MRKRRAAVRRLVHASAVVIAQAAAPQGAAAETFEDGFGGGETTLDWISHRMFEGGAVEGQSAKDRTVTARSACCGTKAVGLPR